jgi:hypothetical protein
LPGKVILEHANPFLEVEPQGDSRREITPEAGSLPLNSRRGSRARSTLQPARIGEMGGYLRLPNQITGKEATENTQDSRRERVPPHLATS